MIDFGAHLETTNAIFDLMVELFKVARDILLKIYGLSARTAHKRINQK